MLLLTAGDLNFDSLGAYGHRVPGIMPNHDRLPGTKTPWIVRRPGGRMIGRAGERDADSRKMPLSIRVFTESIEEPRSRV